MRNEKKKPFIFSVSIISHTFNTNTGINMFLNAGEKITHLLTERGPGENKYKHLATLCFMIFTQFTGKINTSNCLKNIMTFKTTNKKLFVQSINV